MRKKSIWVKIQFNPYLRAIAEVLFTVFFTFFPIILLSVPLSGSEGDLEWKIVTGKFWSYWTSGQLVLPILGLCGAVAALAALNSRALNNGWSAVTFLAAVAGAMIGGYALATSNGFSEELYPEIIWSGFCLYFALLLVWFFLSAKVNRGQKGEYPEDRVENLLKEKQRAVSEGEKS